MAIAAEQLARAATKPTAGPVNFPRRWPWSLRLGLDVPWLAGPTSGLASPLRATRDHTSDPQDHAAPDRGALPRRRHHQHVARSQRQLLRKTAAATAYFVHPSE
jgi:hypothetical protein